MNQTQYVPNYAVIPGDILEEHLEARHIQKKEFAARTGLSTKHISQIIGGKASITPEVALHFERVLGMDASIWLGLEKEYQLFIARQEQQKQITKAVDWARVFPVAEMAKLGWIPQGLKSWDEKAMALLRFFGIAEPKIWEEQYATLCAHCRKSTQKTASTQALSAWYRRGVQQLEGSSVGAFDLIKFKTYLEQIRKLTALAPEQSLPQAKELCIDAGVYLVVEPHLAGTHISGMASWIDNTPLIQLSLRFKTADHLWFSFFHEAAHVLLHSKKKVFLDEEGYGESNEEQEANKWASDFLIPPKAWDAFVRTRKFSSATVKAFAQQQGIGADIVVGRLQFDKLVEWNSPLNELKRKVEITNA